MGILLAFFAGWATCAKAGTESHDEVVAALKAVRDSEEVADLLGAMRSHAGFALREFGNRLLEAGDGRPVGVPDVLARVRAMLRPRGGAAR
jgi:hypothetical protein